MEMGEEGFDDIRFSHGNETIDVDDPEAKLLESLSALAALDETTGTTGRTSSASQSSLPASCSARWSQKSLLANFWENISSEGTAPRTDSNPWIDESSRISTQLQGLTPFQVHSSASQALIFSEDSNTFFPAVCLLLCSWSLTQCPLELARWKRWQSMLCETVRLFQAYQAPTWELSLWINYLLPSFQSVKLPPEALHVGITAGLIGTTLDLIEKHPKQVTICISACEKIMSRQEILSHPWTAHSFRRTTGDMVENENVPHWRKDDSLAWWTEYADGHDSVNAMDTSWSARGMACMAYECWQNENGNLESFPQVLWNTYFPHIPHLLLDDALIESGLSMLQSMVSTLPHRTMAEWRNIPTNPIGTLQLLSNKLISASQRQDQPATTVMVTILKSLVDMHIPGTQVELIEDLTMQCPYRGLVPKLLDLLRPLVWDQVHCPELWIFLHDKCFHDMLTHMDSKGELIDVAALLDKVEAMVSAASLLQLQLMMMGTWPEIIDGSSVGGVLKAVRAKLKEWASQEERPCEFHRLYLLQAVLEQIETLRIDRIKDKKQNA